MVCSRPVESGFRYREVIQVCRHVENGRKEIKRGDQPLGDLLLTLTVEAEQLSGNVHPG